MAEHEIKSDFSYLTKQSIENKDCINCDETKPTHNICMDCVIKIGKQNQTEISDEEIEKAVDEYYNDDRELHNPFSYRDGIEWYKEQLKKKQ